MVNDEERNEGSKVAIGNIAQNICASKRRPYKQGEPYNFVDAVGEEELARNLELFDR